MIDKILTYAVLGGIGLYAVYFILNTTIGEMQLEDWALLGLFIIIGIILYAKFIK